MIDDDDAGHEIRSMKGRKGAQATSRRSRNPREGNLKVKERWKVAMQYYCSPEALLWSRPATRLRFVAAVFGASLLRR